MHRTPRGRLQLTCHARISRNLDAYLEVGNQMNHDNLEVQAIPDYHDWWRERLAQRHRFRPIPRDHRLLHRSE